jgi:hypothetical protein
MEGEIVVPIARVRKGAAMSSQLKRAIPVFLLLVLCLSSCGTPEPIQDNNEEWTTPDADPNGCDRGSSSLVFISRLEITPLGDATTLWFSYNGWHCDQNYGSSQIGELVQWFQVVKNSSNELLIKVYDTTLQDTGWVYCTDVTFLNTLDEYKAVLSGAKYALFEKCYQVSGGSK